MEHNPGADWLTEAAKAAEQQGPGNLLRIVLIVMVVGCVLVGWFLLRGYRQGSDGGARRDAGGDSADRTSGENPSADRTSGENPSADRTSGESASPDRASDEGADSRNG
ncbi:hypothetical protein IPZ68_35345 [Streptomyces arenae]|nr:hypothetical protein [Streptomyces arenae]